MPDYLTSDFDFELPTERIAQTPAEPRDHARLLYIGKKLSDYHIYDLPDLLRANDILVLNDTKVIPARLYGVRGAVKVEILLHKKEKIPLPPAEGVGGGLKMLDTLSPAKTKVLRTQGQVFTSSPSRGEEHSCWLAFARPGKRLKTGDEILFAPNFSAAILEKREGGEILIRFSVDDDELLALLEKYGEPPLPPYIRREEGNVKQDSARYQTVYAKREGAVAAPTAGLHFTGELLEKLKAKGIETFYVTLHVGAGTFLPVKADHIKNHVMHAEWGEISQSTANELNKAHREGRRIIAVGTTVLRLLESAVDEKGFIKPFSADTAIFITPGYEFKAVDALLTNFHLPKSTLFMLVSAFAGIERMKAAYKYAIAKNYRFYSYGDATLLEKASL